MKGFRRQVDDTLKENPGGKAIRITLLKRKGGERTKRSWEETTRKLFFQIYYAYNKEFQKFCIRILN
jgi:hypothetical protein